MKYAHYIVILIGIILFSCKKYQNDPFYSTYTVESRLTKGGIWSCNKIKRADGKEYLLKEYQYYFDLALTTKLFCLLESCIMYRPE